MNKIVRFVLNKEARAGDMNGRRPRIGREHSHQLPSRSIWI
jgi:hypothetical protein